MYFSMAPPGPKISAMVGFLISGWLSRDGARSGCGDTAARGCPFSLARFGIGRRVRAIFPENPRNSKRAHRECHSHLHPIARLGLRHQLLRCVILSEAKNLSEGSVPTRESKRGSSLRSE